MKKKLFFLVIALQTLFLLGLIFQQEWGLKSGKLILLETNPVDPRDLLRGDYVTLSYKMSVIPSASLLSGMDAMSSKKMTKGKNVYVLLEANGKFYEMVEASYEKLKPKKGQVLLEGTDVTNSPDSSYRAIQYGLERFYVPEGKGILPWDKKISVEVAVSASGKGILKDLFIDGQTFREYLRQAKP